MEDVDEDVAVEDEVDVYVLPSVVLTTVTTATDRVVGDGVVVCTVSLCELEVLESLVELELEVCCADAELDDWLVEDADVLDGVEDDEVDDCCVPLAVVGAGVEDDELPVAPDPKLAPTPRSEVRPPTTEERNCRFSFAGVRFPKIESNHEAFVMARHSASIERNRI